MNDSKANDDLLLEIFRSAANAQPTTESSHPVDDDDLLISWSLGDLGEARHAEVLDHMDVCSYCRRELARMIKAGVLVLPDAEEEAGEEQPEPNAVVRPQAIAVSFPSREASGKPWTWTLLAVAASLLIAVIVWSLSEPGSQQILALAQRDLDRGEETSALDRIDQLLDKSLDVRTRKHAEQLLEESAYRLGRERLRDADFERVRELDDIVSRREVDSARLESLKNQAKRRIPAEYALDHWGTLRDYGYDLRGEDLRKGGLPTFDEATDELIEAYPKQVDKHPDSIELRLNYGQFLLSLGDGDGAREQFAAAVELDGKDARARLGLGLAEFGQSEFQAALAEFEAVLRVEPESLPGHLNKAIALRQLKRPAEALVSYRLAAELTDDEKLRSSIDDEIKRIEAHLSQEAKPNAS